MPSVAPRIFISATISNTGGTSNAVTYSLIRTEDIVNTETPIEDMIEDGQTVQNGFDNAVGFDCYDLAILSDARVQYGGTIPTGKARLVMNPAPGSVTETTDGLRLSGVKMKDAQQREFARIKSTRKSVNAITTTS